MKKKPSNSAFGALQEDLLSAIDNETWLEKKDSGFMVVSSNKKGLRMLLGLHIPWKVFFWVVVGLIGVILTALKLDPSILNYLQNLLKGP